MNVDVIEVFVQATAMILVYAALLTVQKIYRKASWGSLFKKGDPWFFINLPISIAIGTPLAKNIVRVCL